MLTIPTIKISQPDNQRGGFAVINADDFDAKRHKRFDDEGDGQITREAITSMGKADVRELIEAHGGDVAKGAKVEDMRADLTRIVFMGDE